MSPQEFEKDQSPGPHLLDNSCYHSISLHKGQVNREQFILFTCYANNHLPEENRFIVRLGSPILGL